MTTAEGRRKRLNPPHVNYGLRDTDIYSDLHLLKRGGNVPRSMVSNECSSTASLSFCFYAVIVQLDAILFDVFPSGSDTLVYHETRFERGHALVLADKV